MNVLYTLLLFLCLGSTHALANRMICAAKIMAQSGLTTAQMRALNIPAPSTNEIPSNALQRSPVQGAPAHPAEQSIEESQLLSESTGTGDGNEGLASESEAPNLQGTGNGLPDTLVQVVQQDQSLDNASTQDLLGIATRFIGNFFTLINGDAERTPVSDVVRSGEQGASTYSITMAVADETERSASSSEVDESEARPTSPIQNSYDLAIPTSVIDRRQRDDNRAGIEADKLIEEISFLITQLGPENHPRWYTRVSDAFITVQQNSRTVMSVRQEVAPLTDLKRKWSELHLRSIKLKNSVDAVQSHLGTVLRKFLFQLVAFNVKQVSTSSMQPSDIYTRALKPEENISDLVSDGILPIEMLKLIPMGSPLFDAQEELMGAVLAANKQPLSAYARVTFKVLAQVLQEIADEYKIELDQLDYQREHPYWSRFRIGVPQSGNFYSPTAQEVYEVRDDEHRLAFIDASGDEQTIEGGPFRVQLKRDLMSSLKVLCASPFMKARLAPLAEEISTSITDLIRYEADLAITRHRTQEAAMAKEAVEPYIVELATPDGNPQLETGNTMTDTWVRDLSRHPVVRKMGLEIIDRQGWFFDPRLQIRYSLNGQPADQVLNLFSGEKDQIIASVFFSRSNQQRVWDSSFIHFLRAEKAALEKRIGDKELAKIKKLSRAGRKAAVDAGIGFAGKYLAPGTPGGEIFAAIRHANEELEKQNQEDERKRLAYISGKEPSRAEPGVSKKEASENDSDSADETAPKTDEQPDEQAEKVESDSTQGLLYGNIRVEEPAKVCVVLPDEIVSQTLHIWNEDLLGPAPEGKADDTAKVEERDSVPETAPLVASQDAEPVSQSQPAQGDSEADAATDPARAEQISHPSDSSEAEDSRQDTPIVSTDSRDYLLNEEVDLQVEYLPQMRPLPRRPNSVNKITSEMFYTFVLDRLNVKAWNLYAEEIQERHRFKVMRIRIAGANNFDEEEKKKRLSQQAETYSNKLQAINHQRRVLLRYIRKLHIRFNRVFLQNAQAQKGNGLLTGLEIEKVTRDATATFIYRVIEEDSLLRIMYQEDSALTQLLGRDLRDRSNRRLSPLSRPPVLPDLPIQYEPRMKTATRIAVDVAIVGAVLGISWGVYNYIGPSGRSDGPSVDPQNESAPLNPGAGPDEPASDDSDEPNADSDEEEAA